MCRDEQSESDAELIRRLQAGDISAFDALFNKYRRGLMAYLVQRCSDHALAEDVVQDVFVRFVEHIQGLHPERGAAGWLYRVARNRMIDTVRRRRDVLPGAALPEQADPLQAPPGEALERGEDTARVRSALARLPEKDRDVLTLRFFGDLAFKDIATTLKRPLGTVLWQSRRALQRLRQELDYE